MTTIKNTVTRLIAFVLTVITFSTITITSAAATNYVAIGAVVAGIAHEMEAEQAQILKTIPEGKAMVYGTRSERVGILQEYLKFDGFYQGDTDNSYGPATRTAVKNYQKKYNLVVDGMCGPATTRSINQRINEINSATNFKEDSELMELVFPTNCTRITGMYGEKASRRSNGKRFHSGIDIGAPKYSDVYASADGIVIMKGWENARGNYVVVYHNALNISTLYEHLDSSNVYIGEKVHAGQNIAKVGNSGFYYSGGKKCYYATHLHFGIIKGKMETMSDDLWFTTTPWNNNTLEPDPAYCSDTIKYTYK